MIFVHNLQKSFGSVAVLKGLDLSIGAGAITLMIGANGAGKTTTMRLLAGLADPDEGVIAIAGHDLQRARRDALAALSFLPQAPRFHPRLTVAQVARFHGELRGRDRAASERALDRWGLREHAAVPTAKLSGGLRQRLALAVFDLADAPVRLLDEPGLSLDPEWREHLQNFLVAEAARGKTVLVATHLLAEWNGRAKRCIRIAGGRFAEDVPPDDLCDRRFAAQLHVDTAASCAA